MDPHYLGLLGGYAAATLGWCALCRLDTSRDWSLWTRQQHVFKRPWLEVLLAILAACAVIGVGQMWLRGWRLPETGPTALWAQAVNQALIFSPMVLLLIVRRQPPMTAWIRTDRIAIRIAIGLALAGLALLVFSLLRGRGRLDLLPALVEEAISLPRHLDEAVQVFCEDLTIAIVIVRLAAATGRRWTPAVVVGILFAVGHIPAMLSEGQPLQELLHLVLDAGLAVGVIAVVQRSADIWWFWVVHYTLDMTQFVAVAPVN